jgi:hypothetical protein
VKIVVKEHRVLRVFLLLKKPMSYHMTLRAMFKFCAFCDAPLSSFKLTSQGRYRKYCSEECAKKQGYENNKSIFKSSGFGEAGPSGITEGEAVSNIYACSYDEYHVDPDILAQAEFNEENYAYQRGILLAKNNGLRIRRGGDNWGAPVSIKALNKFK